jgi:integrase
MSERLYRKRGIYYAWFYDAAGRQVGPFSTKTRFRRAALAVLRRRELEALGAPRLSPHQAEADHTIADALTYMVEHGCSENAPETLKMYAKKAGHLVRLIGGTDVNLLTRDDVQRYINTRIEQEGASRSTAHKELVTLRKALKLAQERHLLAQPLEGLIPKVKVSYVPRDRYLSEEEFSQLFDALAPKRRFWFAVAVLTGARLSEVHALRWEEHIRLDTGEILLPGTKTRRAHRRVPIASALRPLLAEHRRPQGPVVDHWGNARRDLAATCDRLGIRRVTPNDLRRTFVSWLKQRGEDSLVVAQLVGHTSTRMVELVYGRLNHATLKRAVDQLPELPGLGSNGVENPGRLQRQERPMRLASAVELREVTVPRGGIEPATRGFSVPCSSWPSPGSYRGKAAPKEETVAILKQEGPGEMEAPVLKPTRPKGRRRGDRACLAHRR